MAKYEITISDDMNELIETISEASGTPVEEILQGFIEDNLAESKVNLVVRQYRDGNLKAMKAWKLSGLTFDEFNALAKE